MQAINHDYQTQDNTSDLLSEWMGAKLKQTSDSCQAHIKNYRFDLATKVIYEFVWDIYCDWYIEFCKIRLQSENLTVKDKGSILNSLVTSLESILIALHPIIPFITEEIWQQSKKYHKFNKKSKLKGSCYRY